MGQPVDGWIPGSFAFIAVFCAPLAIGAPAGAGEPAPPLALYGQLPSLEEPALSPTGDRLAYLELSQGQRYLVVSDVRTGKRLAVAQAGGTKIRALRWYDDDEVLILYSSTADPPFGLIGPRHEWFMLGAWDIKRGDLQQVDMSVEDYRTLDIVTGSLEIRMVDQRPRLFVSGAYVKQQLLPALLKIDLSDDSTKLVAGGDTLGTDWAVDAQGRIAASFDYVVSGRKQGEWVLRLRRDEEMQQVAAGKAVVDPPNIVGFSYDGKALLVEFDTPDGWIWKPLQLADGTWGAPLDAGRTFFEVIRNRLTGQVVGGVQDPLRPRQVFFDPTLQQRWSILRQVYSGERVDLVSHSDDFSKLLIRVFGPRDGDVYVIVDWTTTDLSRFGEVYRGLATFAKVQPIEYRAADGLPISGFLTLPPGKPERNLSLIVMPHGGPAAADVGDFDWWAQALAVRGYAVLQVNYRGSNVTHALQRAGFGEWGRRMQTDLSDGVHDLIARGVVDPKKVCIVGASYGGYAALAGVTLQTGIYRCAVSVAGISDLPEFLRWMNDRMMSSNNVLTSYLDRYLGASGAKDPRLQEISPIDHVAAVTVPVLLIHGRDDTVVPYAQSEEMAKALQRAGKSVVLVSLPHEDHWLSHSATREQMLEAVVSFLERNDPPD